MFRFNNVQNAIQAYHALKRHGIDPRPHSHTEVNIVLMSLERQPKPDPQILVMPKVTTPLRPKRNPNIKLFDGASHVESRSSVETDLTEANGPSSETGENEGPATEASAQPPPPYVLWLQQLWARIWQFIETH